MLKTELIQTLAERTAATKADAAKSLDTVVEIISEALARGEEVRLTGFGTFSVGDRPAREARNPATGEKIDIAASRQPKFKPSKELKDTVNAI